jgi:hypothetical protein
VHYADFDCILLICQVIYGQYHTSIEWLYHVYMYISDVTKLIYIPVHNAAKVD